jgi:DNA-3-methyladenine glycosylase II
MRNAILALKSCDPVLAAIIDKVGPCTMKYRDPIFATLVRSIVYQQVSGKVARVFITRLEQATRGAMTPEAILKLRPSRMRALGLSTAKTLYIRDLARRTRDGHLDFAALPDCADEHVLETLTAVKGIGVWTAQMFLMFALRRPDVFPTGDLGIRKALMLAYGLPALPLPAEMEHLAQAWRPYRSVASWYLWRSLEGDAEI